MYGGVIRYVKPGELEVGDEPRRGCETGRYDSLEIGRHKKHDRQGAETRDASHEARGTIDREACEIRDDRQGGMRDERWGKRQGGVPDKRRGKRQGGQRGETQGSVSGARPGGARDERHGGPRGMRGERRRYERRGTMHEKRETVGHKRR